MMGNSHSPERGRLRGNDNFIKLDSLADRLQNAINSDEVKSKNAPHIDFDAVRHNFGKAK